MSGKTTMNDIKEFIRIVPDYPVSGIQFYDLNSLFSSPIFKKTILSLCDKVTHFNTPTHIAGIESRGFVVGSAVAYELNLPFIMIRKEKAKYPGELLKESYDLEYGKDTLTLQKGLLGHTNRVILVDDLVATAGSMLASKKLIEQTGAKVLGGCTLIDLAYIRKISLEPEFKLYSVYYEKGLENEIEIQ